MNRLLQIGLASWLLGAVALAATTPTGPGDTSDRVRELLARRGDSRELIVDRLVSMGSAAIPELVRQQAGEGQGNAAGVTALEALRRLPVAAVLDHLRQRAREDDSLEVRLATLHVAGELEDALAVPFVLEVLGTFEGPALVAGPPRRMGAQALTALFRADPRGLHLLEGERGGLASAPDEVLPVVLDALEATGPSDAPGVLVLMLGRARSEELRVLELLGRLAARYPWRTRIDVADLVRPLLLRKSARERALGVVLLQELHDPESVDLLLHLLGDRDDRVAERARRALSSLTGVDRGAEPAAWRTFLAEEASRWTDAAPLLETVRTGAGPRRLAAARGLIGFPLHRTEVAVTLVESLDGDPAYVARVLDVLAQVGDRGSVPDVIPLLDHADAAVRAAAHRSLVRLTGERLPADERTWREWAE